MRRKRKRTWLKEHCRQWVRNLRYEGGIWELAASGSDSGEETDEESYDSGLESDDDVEVTTMEVRVVLLPPKDPLQSVRKTLVDELCSEKNRLGPNEAVTYLIFLFSQTETSSRILRELLRELAIMDLSLMIEGFMDFFKIPGYDYPEECRDGIVAIGGPERMLWDKWADWRHDWIRFHRLRFVPWRALVFKRRRGNRIVATDIFKYQLEDIKVDREILPCGCPLYPGFSWYDFNTHLPDPELLGRCSLFEDEEGPLFLSRGALGEREE